VVSFVLTHSVSLKVPAEAQGSDCHCSLISQNKCASHQKQAATFLSKDKVSKPETDPNRTLEKDCIYKHQHKIIMHGTSNTTQFMDTRQQTCKASAAVQTPKANGTGSVMFDLHSTTPSADTNTISTAFPVTSKNLSLISLNYKYEVSNSRKYALDKAPDSPSTLLGDEIDLAEICSPLSSHSSSGWYIDETPPRSPSTVLGDSNDLDQKYSHTSSITSDGYCSAENEPGSPSTIVGEYTEMNAQRCPWSSSSRDIFTENFNDEDNSNTPSNVFGTGVDLQAVHDVSSNPDPASPYSNHDKSEDNNIVPETIQDAPPQATPQYQPERASRRYVPLPGVWCDNVPLVNDLPAFIIKAFTNEDWRFILDAEAKIVVEVISTSQDLVEWFVEVGGKMKVS